MLDQVYGVPAHPLLVHVQVVLALLASAGLTTT